MVPVVGCNEVSTDKQTRGLKFADYGLPAKAPTVRVITALDEAGFKAQPSRR